MRPKPSGIEDRAILAADWLPNNRQNLARTIQTPSPPRYFRYRSPAMASPTADVEAMAVKREQNIRAREVARAARIQAIKAEKMHKAKERVRRCTINLPRVRCCTLPSGNSPSSAGSQAGGHAHEEGTGRRGLGTTGRDRCASLVAAARDGSCVPRAAQPHLRSAPLRSQETRREHQPARDEAARDGWPTKIKVRPPLPLFPTHDSKGGDIELVVHMSDLRRAQNTQREARKVV